MLLPKPVTNSAGSVVVGQWQAILGAPGWTNGQFQFSFEAGVADVNYVTELSPDLVNWTPIVTNMNTPVITVPAPGNAGFFRVQRNLVPLCQYALATTGNLGMNGNGVVADSYNSSDTNLSTGGLYDPTKASTNGDMASISGVVTLGNHTINGNLYLGPNATFTNNPSQVTGQIYTNYNFQFVQNLSSHFMSLSLPTVDANGNPIVWQPAPTTTNIVSTETNYIHDFTDANNGGFYTVDDWGGIVVEAGVTVALQVTTNKFSPASVTINGGMTNSGTLIMYQDSGVATLGGNVTGGSIGNRPQNFIYIGLSQVSSVTLGGLSQYIGVIYAPEANMGLNAAGSANSFCGSCTCEVVTINGHYTFHYDESLLTSGPFR